MKERDRESAIVNACSLGR